MQSLFSCFGYLKIILPLCALPICMVLPGCYYMREGTALLSHQIQSRPISACMRDSTLSDKEKTFFAEIKSIRNYAFDSLGLKQNRNYTRYISIDSTYLVAVLSVADSASLIPKKWCYPIFGCFPLRAYHDINNARRAGKKFIKKGYEINIDKVDGFSTLGIFSDPLYSFMADYPVFSLARFLFHEQMHATAYFKNVQFSEEIATFIGNEGALAYLKMRFGDDSPQYCNALDFIEDQATWLAMLRNLYGTLDTLYRSSLSREEKIAKKLEITGNFSMLIRDSYDSLFTTKWFKGLEKRDFNNAYLAVRMTYNMDLAMFTRLREKRQGKLSEVVRFAKELKKRKGDPKELLAAELEDN